MPYQLLDSTRIVTGKQKFKLKSLAIQLFFAFFLKKLSKATTNMLLGNSRISSD